MPPAFVRFERSGDASQRQDLLVIHADGRAQLTTERGGSQEFRLRASVLRDLRLMLADARFQTLDISYRTGQVPSVAEVAISHIGRTVSLDDDQAAPAPLLAVVRVLDEMIARHDAAPPARGPQ